MIEIRTLTGAEHRGQGIGHAFFDHREQQARRCGAVAVTFASVVRSADHPARPADYVPLDGFWKKRGYAPIPGFLTELSWREHNDTEETPKQLQNWLRRF